MLWLLPLAAIDTSPAGCDAIMSKMTYTRSSTRHLPCRSVGIGSLINNDLVPAFIADQAFPQFRCHALGLHSCAPREVFRAFFTMVALLNFNINIYRFLYRYTILYIFVYIGTPIYI